MTGVKTYVRKLFILYFLHCLVSSEKPWRKLPNNTGTFCSSRDICYWKAQQPYEYSSSLQMESCCRDCSCQSTCGEDGTCCFKELDTTNGSHQKYKSCLQPSIPEIDEQYAHQYVHYLMVDSNPDDGCILDVPEIPDGEQCGNIPVGWLGTKYPVYSKTKKIIYKNEYCAQCHNATEVTMTSISLHGCSLHDFNTALLSGNKTNNELDTLGCHLSASFHDFEDELKLEQCFLNVVDSCPVDFNVPDDFDMTMNDIKLACHSGLISYYISSKTAIYLNVFCAWCNDKYLYGREMCNTQRILRTTSHSTFSILLDNRLMNIPKSTAVKHQGYKKVCFAKDIRVHCRPIFCPYQMILINGECTFMSQRLLKYSFVVTLKLIPHLETQLNIHHLHSQNPVLNKISSWSNKWKLFNILAKDNSFYSNSTLVEKLIVRMIYHSKNINPVNIFEEIKSNLRKTRFDLQIDNSSYEFHQTMAEFRTLDYKPQFNQQLYRRFSVHGLLDLDNQTILEKIYKDHIYIAIPFKNKIMVTINMVGLITFPTCFCDLVQLQNNEYEMFTNGIVYYKLLDKVLFDGQFITTTDDNGETAVRICLSESGFSFIHNGSTTAQAYITWIWYQLFGYQLLISLGVCIRC